MIHVALSVSHHTTLGKRSDDTTYDACSVCHHAALAKRKDDSGLLNFVYLSGPQTKTYNTLVKRKNDTNYDALFVYIPCATHPFVASVV